MVFSPGWKNEGVMERYESDDIENDELMFEKSESDRVWISRGYSKWLKKLFLHRRGDA